jgi:carboxymethylenebutenolidase
MGQMVTFPSNGKTANGYLATPAQSNGKGVVVIQEWWGLVPHIKEVADRFAAQGYTALAPDLYHGQTANEPTEAGKLFMALNVERAELDLRGAINCLAAQSTVTNKKVGVVGFCMGGALSLFAASKNPTAVGACVIFYGIHPNVKPDLDALTAPVLGLYAEKDGFVTPEVVRGLESELKQRGKSVEMHIYPDVDHAFFNNERADVYHKASAADAWRRTLEFFDKRL